MKTSNDPRHSRQSWANNPLVSSSDAALAQAVYPMLDWARLQKNVVNKFNDKGRPENIVEWSDFQCIITQDGDRSRRATAGGDQSQVHFTVMYLKPLKLQIGDILVHRTFGAMKIEGFNGLTEMGLTSARAVGINAGEDIEDGEAIRNEPREIF